MFEAADIHAAEPAKTPGVQPVYAPAAERIVMAALSAHPDLRKMGLHAVPLGGTNSVIIANGNRTRIGIPSTPGDLAAIQGGQPYCQARADGSYYNMKLPLSDAAGRPIGILVMEIPFTSASDSADALRKAENIRKELANRSPVWDGCSRLTNDEILSMFLLTAVPVLLTVQSG